MLTHDIEAIAELVYRQLKSNTFSKPRTYMDKRFNIMDNHLSKMDHRHQGRKRPRRANLHFFLITGGWYEQDAGRASRSRS